MGDSKRLEVAGQAADAKKRLAGQYTNSSTAPWWMSS